MTDTTYNGWPNRETWCVALWIGNDQGMYYQAREMAAGMGELVMDPDEDFDLTDARYKLAEQLKNWIEEVAEMTCPGSVEGASFVSDLLGYSLAQVDWYEIAGNELEDALEGVDA